MARGRKPTPEDVVFRNVLTALNRGEKPPVNFVQRAVMKGLVDVSKSTRTGRGRKGNEFSVNKAGLEWLEKDVG